ncbi:MAG TPA: hypothetical protein VH062_23610 [Polyangiaceae bacterium]|jgi:hypothetical protein|nr:hypothetical protein [Polyangiaceae bacterium]
MNRKLRGLIFTVPGIIIGVAGATSCNKIADAAGDISAAACGPCGTIASGDFSVSGDAQLDGFFQAVGNLQNATASVQGDFQANIVALATAYGVDATAGFDASLTDKVIAAIKADVSANLDGGFKIAYKAPACQASVDVAVSAQAQCEAKAKCDVKVNPGQASVKCSGTCSGGCSGSCSGDLSCTVTTPTVDCEGTCEGSCELSAAASCDGTCHGKCSGTCSATDANGDCQGSCTGMCTGSCEFKAAAKCMGTCHGSCHVNQGSAQCTGSVQCSGKCDAQCSGGCQGDFEPPSASASCDASAKCQAQAKAQAKASLQCQPPRLDLDYGFKAGVKASAQADFVARLGVLKVRAGAIVQGAARMTALVTGKVDGNVVFSPSPVDDLTASIKGFASADAIAHLDIPAGRLGCVVPAFVEAGTDIGNIASTTADTISAQAKFVGYITTGS